MSALSLASGRRLRIEHRSGFRYASPVAASYNEARMSPLTTPTQTTLESRVHVEPMTWSMTYWDYWGSQVTAFEVLTPHEELTVVSTSLVELYPADDNGGGDAGWDDLRAEPFPDSHTEWLTQTRWTAPPEDVVELARDAAGGLPPDAAARAVCTRLREGLDYRPGVTAVSTSAAEFWERRQGVCQDFAHLAIGALRELGIPARYVSGYLQPSGPQVGRTREGASHAWIEWWAGGWRPFDPTSAAPTAADHVLVARGRDYGDVTPLKGVYAGPAESTLFVSVEVTVLA